MFGHVPWYVTALIIIGATILVARALRGRKPHSGRQSAIQRLEKFGHKKSLDPAEIETLVQEIIDDQDALTVERAANQGAPLPTKTKIQAIPDRHLRELEDVEALVQQILEPHTAADSGPTETSNTAPAGSSDRPALDRGQASPSEPDARRLEPLRPGTKVQAVRNFRSVKKGAFGIITGEAGASYFGSSWSRYPCTFANNIKISARSRQIQVCNHNFSLEELEHPDFATIQSRLMVLKAQKLSSGPRRQIEPIRP